MEILLVNLRAEVFKCMKKIIIYYVTTITYAMWMILTHSLNDSAVPFAIRSFRKREISTAMLKRVKKRAQHFYPKSLYTLRETLFDKLDVFGISYNDDQKQLKAVKRHKKNHLDWNFPISSNLIGETVFLCDKDPKGLIISFVEAIEDLTNKSKTEMLTKFSSV